MERCELCSEDRPVYVERTLPGGVILLCGGCKDLWQDERRAVRRSLIACQHQYNHQV